MTDTLLSPGAVRHDRASAWAEVIARTEPTVMVTLGTNRDVGEQSLIRSVSEALHRLDCKRNATKRVQKLNPRRRITAFIIPEKVDLNAHAHLAIWHQSLLRADANSQLPRSITKQRDHCSFIGWTRGEYSSESYHDDPRQAPYLERIWRKMVPGAHYHARWFDPMTRENGADYLVKELRFVDERDIRISAEFWPEKQQAACGGLVFQRT